MKKQDITVSNSQNVTNIQAGRDVYIQKVEDPQITPAKGKTPPFSVQYSPNPQFTDPHNYLQKLHQELSAHQTIAVQSKYTLPPTQAVIGMAGIGKTQLAIEYAYYCKEAYPGGIFWVQGADGVSLEYEFVCLAPVIGISKRQDERDAVIVSEVAEYLSEQKDKALLIIDNLQTLSRLSERIGDTNITIKTIECRKLITTRLDCSDKYSSIKLDILPKEEAILLLCHRLQCKIKGSPWERTCLFSVDEIKATLPQEEYESAEKIVCLLGCLPLAVVIASACIAQKLLPDDKTPEALNKLKPFTSFYQRLKERGLFTTDEFSLSPEELATTHDTIMKATIGLSYEMLTDAYYDPQAKKLFKIIPLFLEATSIRLDLLAIAAGMEDEDARRAARRLLKLSLVVDIADNILRIHPLVRQFAYELSTPKDREEIFDTAMQNLIQRFSDAGYLEYKARQLPNLQGLDAIADDFLLLLNLANQHKHDSVEVKQLSSLWRAFSIERRYLEEALPEGRFDTLPAFFYQQWQNRLFEEGLVELSKSIPAPKHLSSQIWLKTKHQLKTHDPALIRIFSSCEIGIRADQLATWCIKCTLQGCRR